MNRLISPRNSQYSINAPMEKPSIPQRGKRGSPITNPKTSVTMKPRKANGTSVIRSSGSIRTSKAQMPDPHEMPGGEEHKPKDGRHAATDALHGESASDPAQRLVLHRRLQVDDLARVALLGIIAHDITSLSKKAA